MKRVVLISAALACLAGCASFKEFAHRHPVVTGVGAALIVGSIAVAAKSDGGNGQQPLVGTPGTIGNPNMPGCRPQPDGSCR
jgi:hypothetical protein